MNQKEYVRAIKSSQKIIASGKYNACPCTNRHCPWHSKCFECVMIHRVKKHHVPECLQPILRDNIAALNKAVELKTVDDRPPEILRRQAKAIVARCSRRNG